MLVLCVYLYGASQFSWFLFFILLFAPDISALGYLLSNKVGSITYNLFHTYSLPITLIIYGIVSSTSSVVAISLVWIAHIGMDRMIGYGLKYPAGFKDNHLNRV